MRGKDRGKFVWKKIYSQLALLRPIFIFPNIVFLGIVFTGIALRVSAYANPSFWLDEAWRIVHILDAQNIFTQICRYPSNIDPPMFNIGLHVLANIHNTEAVIRLISLIPGILAIFVSYFLSRKIFHCKWTAILVSFYFAFNTTLIVFSKELKPYILVLFIHLLVLLSYFHFRSKEGGKNLAVFTCILITAVLFAVNVIFVFPAIYTALLYRQIKNRNFPQVKKIVFSAIIVVLFLTGYYFVIFSGGNGQGLVNYWAKSFSPGDSFFSHISWFIKGHVQYIKNAMSLDIGIFSPKEILGVIYIVLSVSAFVFLYIKKKYEEIFIFLMPLFVMAIFNLLRLWPFGMVRMNLFLFVYVVFVPLYVIEAVVSSKKTALRVFGFVFLAFLMIVQFPYNINKLRTQRYIYENIKEALLYIINENQKHDDVVPIMMNWKAEMAYRYYSEYHKYVAPQYKKVASRFKPIIYASRKKPYVEKKTSEILHENQHLWVLLSHYRKHEPGIMLNRKFVDIKRHVRYRGADVYIIFSKIYKDRRELRQETRGKRGK